MPLAVGLCSVAATVKEIGALSGQGDISCLEDFQGHVCWSWDEKLRFLSLPSMPSSHSMPSLCICRFSRGQAVCVGDAVTGPFGASSLMYGYSDSFSQNRSDQQCQYRWLRVLNPDLVKGPWTKEEDQKVSPGRAGAEP